MIVYDANTKTVSYVEDVLLSAEEIAALEAAREAEQEAEKHRPPTADERLEALEAALLEMIMEENT